MVKNTQSFSLDEEVSNFLEDRKWKYRKDMSIIVNEALKYFMNNEAELKKILEVK